MATDTGDIALATDTEGNSAQGTDTDKNSALATDAEGDSALAASTLTFDPLPIIPGDLQKRFASEEEAGKKGAK